MEVKLSISSSRRISFASDIKDFELDVDDDDNYSNENSIDAAENQENDEDYDEDSFDLVIKNFLCIFD